MFFHTLVSTVGFKKKTCRGLEITPQMKKIEIFETFLTYYPQKLVDNRQSNLQKNFGAQNLETSFNIK